MLTYVVMDDVVPDMSVKLLDPHFSVVWSLLSHEESRSIVAVAEQEMAKAAESDPDEREALFRDGVCALPDDESIRPNLWEVLQPFVPRLTSFAMEKGQAWVQGDQFGVASMCVRRYSLDGSSPNRLVVHRDASRLSATVALTNGAGGGGLFFVREEVEEADGNLERYVTDAWLRTVPRQNTSALLFPHVPTGAAVLYDNTVWHGVAPVQEELRYSLTMFYTVGVGVEEELDEERDDMRGEQGEEDRDEEDEKAGHVLTVVDALDEVRDTQLTVRNLAYKDDGDARDVESVVVALGTHAGWISGTDEKVPWDRDDEGHRLLVVSTQEGDVFEVCLHEVLLLNVTAVGRETRALVTTELLTKALAARVLCVPAVASLYGSGSKEDEL